MQLKERCIELTEALGLGRADQVSLARPLTGGVASDIAEVQAGNLHLCMKFALPKLRVQEEWLAPVHRNKAEYAWLTYVRGIAPENTPELFGRSDSMNGFAMEYLSGNDIYLWKDALLAGKPGRGEAAAVADLLGTVHAASTKPDFDATPFWNRDDFRALRIEPYLLFTATKYPDLSSHLNRLAEGLYAAKTALVHGDVSPKNIILRDKRPVILDAECATMGDPCFDVAFCLNHLLLKSVHMPECKSDLMSDLMSFRDVYLRHVDWEDPDAFEGRVAALLPALFLARVDGKSPVDYLDHAGREKVRRIAIPLIRTAPPRLSDIVETLLSDRNEP